MLNNELWQAPPAGGGDFYSHQIANSCRFNNNYPAVENLSRTQGTPTDVDKCTISVWLKRSETGAFQRAFTGSGKSGAGYSQLNFGGSGGTADEFYYLQNPGSTNIRLESTAVYRDVSAWMNIVIAQDSTQSTAADRNKIYFNGVQYTDWGDYSTYSTLNSDFLINTSGHKIFVGSAGGGDGAAGLGFDGYIAEYVFIDGTQNAVTDFGESKNGVWIPKDPSGLTFGNNGCYLKFESSSDLGNDSSGNNNDFTVHANVTAHDQMLDSPTFGSEGSANFPTVNVLDPTLTASVVSNGNLQLTETITNFGAKANFAIPLTGKWYWEAYVNNGSGQETWAGITGIDTDSSGEGRGGSGNATTYGAAWSNYSGSNMYIRKYIAGVESAESGSFGSTSDTIIGIAVNRDDNEIKLYKNNALQITNAISATQEYFPAGGGGGGTDSGTIGVWNFGQDGTFAGNETAQGNADGNGYGNFYYSPPTDFLALCSGNLPVADAVDPAQTDDDYPQELFKPVLYSGNGGTNNITGVGFQPDLVWIKSDSTTYNHRWWDSSRGVQKYIESDTSDAEATLSTGLTSFNSDGFTLGSGGSQNNGSNTFVAWNWRANGGTTSTNDSGSIDSTVQTDPSGSFSIVSYTGYDSTWDNMSTVGHGLSSAPDCILLKPLTNIPWEVFFGDLGGTGGGSTAAGNSLVLNTTGALYTNQTYRTWGDVMPTSTVFTVNGNNANAAGVAIIAYCFANTEGYIKSGVYEGNGNADGSFVYCGFRPALIMTKSLDSTSDWQMFDDTRVGYNVDNNALVANATAAETTTDMIDILSNGFKMRIATDPNVAETYVYLAIAKNPFQFATAR